MTTAALPRIPTSPVGNRIVQVAVDVVEGINEGRKMAWRYEKLSRMSNAELARLGLTRYDIPRAAVNGIAGF
jgi:hypothetical protein